jgi:hypothetical protein
MVFARLEAPIQPGNLEIGPVDHLRITGRALCLGDGSEVALHQSAMWISKGICYIAIQIDHPVQLEFGHTEYPLKEEFGPFGSLRIVDGALWAGEPPVLIARFDDVVSHWHIYARPAAGMNLLVIRRA